VVEEINIIINFMIGVIFALIGIVLLSVILAQFNPYDQVAFANAERLRAAMEEACMSNKAELTFSLPQNVPVFGSGLAQLGQIPLLPAWQIVTKGDPKYVLYYESFPVGEAVGWEIYFKNMGYRVAAPLKEGADIVERSKIAERITEVGDKFDESYKSVNNTEGKKIFVNNIILNSELDSTTGRTLDDPKKAYGSWDRNDFIFSNYIGMSGLEKTLVKYQPCGSHTLCLKTTTGIYSFPLKYCDEIKYIHIYYDARNKAKGYKAIGAGLGAGAAAIGGIVYFGVKSSIVFALKTLWWSPTITVGAAAYGADSYGEYLFNQFITYKSSDFYVASPCSSLKMEIKKADCSRLCSNLKNYPIYSYENGLLVKKGEHYTCLDNINGTEPDVGYSDSISTQVKCYLEYKGCLLNTLQKQKTVKECESEYDNCVTGLDADNGGDCLKVLISETPEGYCWTPNVNARGLTNIDTRLFASLAGMTPVTKNSEYMKEQDAVIMKDADYSGFLVSFIKDTMNIDWPWP